MARVISVILGTLILLSVGYYLGSRPAARLADQLDQAKGEFQIKIGEFEARALEAEGLRDLWRVRAELLVAAVRADEGEREDALRHAGRAVDLTTRAAARPGLQLDLTDIQAEMSAALDQLRNRRPTAAAALRRVSGALAVLLDRQQA